jgi:hydroxymethylglutaryl-CoA lyase
MTLPAFVHICEVGTRDGFQIEAEFILTDEKIAIVNRVSASKVARIQVTSFVSPKAIPQLRDAEEVVARIQRRPGTVYSALVPNERGAQRAIDAGVDEIDTVLSASDSHNLANVNMPTAESLERLTTVVANAHRAGVQVVAGIATSFGCPFEGEVPIERLEWIIGTLARLDIKGVCLADTTGMANPLQVKQTFERLMPRWPELEWNLHTHDTRGMALANIMTAMEAGVTHFDASIGGVGGCPFAPGASGNGCTEDVVHCLHAMGIETGIDLDALIGTALYAQDVIGHELPGQVMKAGKSDRRYKVPARA